jgi:hypothetical protein
MNPKKILILTVCMLLAVSCFAQRGGMSRGKAEMKAGDSAITIDYGQPALKGRDMLSQLQIGGRAWRMGNNMATVLNSPVDLTFGSATVPKGSYSLWLKRTAEEAYELVFNTQTGQWGMQHDTSQDVHSIPMEKETLSSAVEVFTIDLNEAPGGGVLALSWGTAKLTAAFKF